MRGDGGGREANDEAVQQNTASAPKTSPEGSGEERVRVSCAKRATNARRTGLCPFTVCRSVVARLPPPSRRRWQPRRQSEWRRGDVLRRQSVWRDCRLPPPAPTERYHRDTAGITGASRVRISPICMCLRCTIRYRATQGVPLTQMPHNYIPVSRNLSPSLCFFQFHTVKRQLKS